MNTALDTLVRGLLEANRGQWREIAERADVSHSWISQFVRGKIENPGIATLRRIHDVLVRRQSKGRKNETV